MEPIVIRAELEEELTWRRDEMRFLKNQLVDISGNGKKMKYRKSLIVMLYSHYEGFFKFALLLYVKCINNENIKCCDATAEVVAGSWHSIFNAMESGDKKLRIFQTPLPEGDFIHKFSRRKDFVENLPNFENTSVNIPDSTIDTASNLKPDVLKKNLYRVGLEYDLFNANDGNISRLINHRNNVAHGNQRNGLTSRDYDELERVVFRMMDEFMSVIVSSLQQSAYRRPTPA